jgi:hypothetical protein
MGGRGRRPGVQGAASVLWAVDLPDDGPTGGFYATAARSPGDAHPVRNADPEQL